MLATDIATSGVKNNIDILHLEVSRPVALVTHICRCYNLPIVEHDANFREHKRSVLTVLNDTIKMNPGEISEYDLLSITGESKVTLHRWRKNGGLPYIRRGRNIFYRQEEVQKWLAERFMKRLTRAHDNAIAAFEKEFREYTQQAEITLRTSRAQLSAVLFLKQGKGGPEVDKELDESLKATRRPVLIASQAVAVYRLCRNIERAFVKPMKALTFAYEIKEEDLTVTVISAETRRLAKEILMKSFPDVPESDADEMIARIDSLHDYFTKKEAGTATEDDAFVAFSGRR